MSAGDNSHQPESPYAPPRSEMEEPHGRGAWVGWAPVAAIAAGVAVSIAWTLYDDFELTGGIREVSWLRIGITVAVWGGLTSLLIFRVSWARPAGRALSLLTVVGTLPAFWFGGSSLFFLIAALRASIFAAVFVLLRAPVQHRPPPIWMQPP